jgi:hypothetical protein
VSGNDEKSRCANAGGLYKLAAGGRLFVVFLSRHDFVFFEKRVGEKALRVSASKVEFFGERGDYKWAKYPSRLLYSYRKSRNNRLNISGWSSMILQAEPSTVLISYTLDTFLAVRQKSSLKKDRLVAI